MTAIAPLNIKTKKQLKETISAGESIFFDDPTPWGSRLIAVHSADNRIFVDYLEQAPGYSFTCTNHPKRSWFAEISLTSDGIIKVK